MSQGENAAQGLGDKIKGAANLAHGSGEAVRGNVNSFIDGLGKQAQGQSGASGTHGGVGDSSTTNPGLTGKGSGVGQAVGQGGATRDVQNDVENHATATKGREEFQAGLNAFQKK